MKQIIVFLGIIILFSSSCKKEEKIIIEEIPIDEIVYIDLIPNLILHPCDTFMEIPLGSCSEIIPIPYDSSVKVNIDINQDGDDDFEFAYHTYHAIVSQSSPCANYNSTVSIKGLGSGNKVIVEEANYILDLNMMSYGDSIDNSLVLRNKADVFRDNSNAPYNFMNFSGSGYIGIKLSDGEFAWIKVNLDISTFTFTILEYGYNKNLGSRITAGQIE